MAKYIIDSDLYVELLRAGRYHDIIAKIYTRETANIYFSSVVAQELFSGVINETLIAMSSKAIGATVVTLNSSDFETIKSVRNFSYITA